MTGKLMEKAMILASSSWAVSCALVIAAILFFFLSRQPKVGPKFKVGQKVTWLTSLQTGTIIQVREDDQLYVVEFEPDEIRVLHEERLCH